METAFDYNRQHNDDLHHIVGASAANGSYHEGQVLIVDTDKETVAELKMIFHFLSFQVTTISQPEQLEKILSQHKFQTICLTGSLSQETQEQWIKAITRVATQIKPIILTNNTSGKRQAKHSTYPDNWLHLKFPVNYRHLNDALTKAQIHQDEYLAKTQKSSNLFRSLVGKGAGIQKIRKEIEQSAPTDANVLILGESGTGKEVVARNIHYHSKRRNKAFVPVNCGAIPRDLLESELFGHEKGAFTGAISARQGRFSMAEGGTLFLDEIGDMPMDMQVKLLRVLEERIFERVGGSKSIKADVRIVAATNCNLEKLVAAGTFREDLYFRLEVFPIEIPPLRDRIEDLPLLINQLSERLEKKQLSSVRFAKEAVLTMAQYAWPGNVRELSNIIERLAIQHPFGIIQVHDLPQKLLLATENSAPYSMQNDFFDGIQANIPQAQNIEIARIPDCGMDLKSYISDVEVGLINQALDDADGVVAHAAKLLGLRRTTLAEKMRKYHISRTKN